MRSTTVRETRISFAVAVALMRWAITTAMPVMSEERCSISPVCSPALRVRPWLVAVSRSAAAQRTGAGWAVEGRKDSVAQQFDERATVLRNDSAGVSVMLVEDAPPCIVAGNCELVGGGDDVSEQDGCEDAIGRDRLLGLGQEPLNLGEGGCGVTQKNVRLRTCQLDEPCIRDASRGRTTRRDVVPHIVTTMQHERRRPHRGQ